MNNKRLITSALPYVNNIPHLGNLIQVLSADVFARFCRLRGYETLYVCGTDEYGTATETKALEEGVTPKELCDRFHAIHRDIYDWFTISFDKFGRTSTPEQTAVTQEIFLKLDEAGYIREQETSQLYCVKCRRFLADRYVRGQCPACGYGDARGDQCEDCGKLLDPTELVNPRCGVCGSAPEPRTTKHLYIDLPAILPKLEEWMNEASVRGFWANNAIAMTRSWIRDGLKERCITRDLKWGIPVPKEGFRDKVFYVWFDAPIGYISITATHTADWERWWKNRDEVELFQFIGKDNIPFHTVIFPSSLLGSGEPWTMLHHMSSTEYLNYEGGKFSKSKGIGIFGSDAMETGIPADVWRFYIYYNRPEKSDALFTWKDFQEKVNGELIGNLGNLVNRTLTFVDRFYDGTVPEAPVVPELWNEAKRLETEITEHLERAELRDGFRAIFLLSSLGNKAFQDGEPWKNRTAYPERTNSLIRTLTLLIRDLCVLTEPYIPTTAERISKFLGIKEKTWACWGARPAWAR
jgi:methionyl-tRNA synthetase